MSDCYWSFPDGLWGRKRLPARYVEGASISYYPVYDGYTWRKRFLKKVPGECVASYDFVSPKIRSLQDHFRFRLRFSSKSVDFDLPNGFDPNAASPCR